MGRRVGTTLARKYRLLRLLGAGGMGAVYEAEHARTGRRVAVKLMLGEHARDAELAARFLREARAAGRIEHPNVVQVLDADEAPDGTLFIVQEYLVGHDLRRLLDERRALPPREALEIVVPILSALVAAHRAGVLHRDLKPENIFLARGPGGAVVPKLIDFGIARLVDAVGERAVLTQTGAAMGTPYYMSPEQAKGERSLDAQADVWAMGVVLFEILAGRTPFDGDSYNALLAQILTAPVPRVDAVAPRVPRALADVVATALARDRARRYRSIANLLGALLDCQDVGDPAWRTTLRTAHRAVVVAPDDDGFDTAPTVARAATADVDAVATNRQPARAAVTTLGRSAREIATPIPARAPGVRRLALLGTAALLVTSVGVWHPWSSRRLTPRQPSAAAASVPVPPPATPPPRPAPATYVVAVVARPATATIALDGVATHANELARTFARDGTAHQLVVSAPGFEPTTVEFVDAPPPSTVIALVPRRAPASPRAVHPTPALAVAPPRPGPAVPQAGAQAHALDAAESVRPQAPRVELSSPPTRSDAPPSSTVRLPTRRTYP